MTSNSEHQIVARTWLNAFSAAVTSKDPKAVAATFLPYGWLRDVLVFIWDNRSLRGPGTIASYLAEDDRLSAAQVINIRLDDDPNLQPSSTVDPTGAHGVESGFLFQTCHGLGKGFVRLRQDDDSGWKALTVFMILVDLKGHEEREGQPDYEGQGKTWTQFLAEQKAKVESDPYVLIVGGGQAGLTVAARCNQMNIPALVIEKNARIGDNWRKRYETLVLHTPKEHHQLLYQPFPNTWTRFTPRDKLADWLEAFSISQHVVHWTSSTITGRPLYNSNAGRWDVIVNRNGEQVVLRPAHIVVATGTLGAPRIPDFPHRDTFTGQVLHSVDFVNAKPFVGKHVVVVGAGNTSIDICQDLATSGAASVTMVQRSATCVVSRSNVQKNLHEIWAPNQPVYVGDFKSASMPLGLLREIMIMSQDAQWEQEKELHTKLRKGGLQLTLGPDGEGQTLLVFERGGGYWLDRGAADLIASGDIKVKQGVQPTGFSKDSLLFADDSSLRADVVILATGYINIREVNKQLFGEEVINQTSEIYGLDNEGEFRGSYRPSGHPGLWFATGDLYHCRFFSKQLVIQLKAIQLGLLKA